MACAGLGFKPGYNLAESGDSGGGGAVGERERTSQVSSALASAAETVCDRTPHFVLLGAQKAGSTALYSYITQHPRVVAALRKETHFFDWKWGIYARCKIPPQLEGESFDVLAQSSWEWKQSPEFFPPLQHFDFDTPQPAPPPDADSTGSNTAEARPRPTENTNSGSGPNDQKSLAAQRKKAKLSSSPKSSTRTSKPQPRAQTGSGQEVLRTKKHSKNGPRISCDLMRQKYLLMYPFKKLALDASLVSGEASPSYALYGQVPARMHRLSPNAKLLLLVRDPVARAYSHFNMTRDPVGVPFVKKIRGTYVLGDSSFEDVVQEDIRNLQKHGIDTAAQAVVRSESNGAAAAPSSGTNLTYGNSFDDSYFAALPNGHGAHCYVGRGLYLLQLQQWLKAGYRRDQLLVVCTERLQANPHCELKRVFEFLGLPPCDTIDTTPVNTASQRGRNFGPMAEATRQQLRAFYAPHNKALYEFTGEDYGWQ